jgi:DNA-binding NarL/FixJ family response regulator
MHAIAKIHISHRRPAMSAGLKLLLQSDEWELSICSDQPEALSAADIIITDYETGLDLARSLPSYINSLAILIVTHRDKEWEIRRALDLFIGGYILADASSSELRHAVRSVLNHSRYLCPKVASSLEKANSYEKLTRRENEVLQLLAIGHCNKKIAHSLGLEVGTTKWYVHVLMGKLGTSTRTHAVAVAAQRGLVDFDKL